MDITNDQEFNSCMVLLNEVIDIMNDIITKIKHL